MIAHIHTLISFLRQPDKRKWIKLARSLKNKKGLEIGGPSTFFKTGKHLPIYVFADKVDVANYSASTVWEGNIREGLNYNYFGNKVGYQYISEATNLEKIKDEQYDFILSCHSLEHVANPLKALFEWRRVLKPNGALIIVLPYKEATFDYKRPFTTFAHVLEDYSKGIDEHDITHIEEVIALHDASKDEGYGSEAAFKQRLEENFTNRCMHHHVFDGNLVCDMLGFAGFSVNAQEIIHGFHLTTFAVKEM